MNSKEALEQLRKYNGIGLCGDYTLFEPIEKDLEILEILKKSIKETGISKGDGTIILKWELFDIKEQKSFNLFNITIKNEEDFEKVKEWLNDK